MKRLATISALLVLLLLLIGTLAADSGSRAAPPARPGESGAEPTPDGISAPESPMPSGTPEEAVEEEPAVKAPRAAAKKLELEGQVPDELLGEGDATLTLRLISSDTGQPVASSVRLWRLGVPAGGGWTWGDQIQRLLDVQAGGVVVDDLPAGWYRVQANGQRKGAGDPPRFQVPDGPSSQDVEVAMPRTFRARLRVFDADGRELLEAALGSGAGGSTGRTNKTAPAWAEPRRPEGGAAGFLEGFHCRRAVYADRGVVRADPEGFDLGEVQESARKKRWSRGHRITVPGSNEVICGATGDDGGNVTYYGIVVPIERVVAEVRLPNGDPLHLDLLKIEARCFAEALADDAAPGAWREIPIHVVVKLEGHKPLLFNWRLDEPAPERRFVLRE